MTLKTIALELARNPGFPEGDANHGYVFRAPLNERGYFDRYQWAVVKPLCRVRRIESGEEVESGLLILNRHGKWVFSYENGDADDESLFKLGAHRFVPGEYIAITEHDGQERTFKVASVVTWHPDRSEAVAAG